MGIRVLGTGSYTPAFQVTNEDMAKIVETNDEWIRTRTGIGTRHISDGEPTWYYVLHHSAGNRCSQCGML